MPIDLERQPKLWAIEIEDEPIDCTLPPEFVATERSIPKPIPESLFADRRMFTKRSGTISQMTGRSLHGF